jgi:DNA mismatch repair protein MutS
MRQYDEIKKEYSDCILFFRMGDFYELFGDDAVVASRILGITLTKRNNGAAGEMPLCGFPYHAAERYVPKMVQAGFKIAICEQVEDPKLAKGIVKREVIEVVTAGTSFSEQNLEASSNSFLCALCIHLPAEQQAGLAVVDVSTGFFQVLQGSYDLVVNELFRLCPKELLLNSSTDHLDLGTPDWEQQFPFLEELKSTGVLITPDPNLFLHTQEASELICRQLHIESIDALGLEGLPDCIISAGAVLKYVLQQKKNALEHIQTLELRHLGEFMTLDPPTLRNLELLQPLNGEDQRTTLVHVLDKTVTAMGARELKQWISHPLLKAQPIQQRLDSVQELMHKLAPAQELRDLLRGIYDIERLIGRVGSGRANARDIQALGQSVLAASAICQMASVFECFLLQNTVQAIPLVQALGQKILHTLQDELPLTLREGKLIRAGANADLDTLNEGIREAREWLANLESREKQRLGISSLRVGYNKVFGYYLEITNTHADKVPTDYIRKQTLANAERYITPEMKEYESKILSAEGSIHDLEYRVFCTLRDEVSAWIPQLRVLANQLAILDVLQSMAVVCRKHGYCRPQVHEGNELNIQDGWHPIIKSSNPDLEFITNDLVMDPQSLQVMLITGPNMAGKSTYLRQCALIVLMAQIGCYVPAAQASIGIVDRIFTRVGASDRLARGQSTFMVEMVETSNILRNASSKSLLLLDEIGRGTSTFDGLSLAWAIIEHLHETANKQAKTLFATHYHELNALSDSLPRVHNYRVTVEDNGSVLLFLRKIIPGACDSSYGIHVAEMAGLPKEVIFRAKRILHRLETHRTDPSDMHFETQASKPQLDLFAPLSEGEQLVLKEIKEAKPEHMSPMQALAFIADIQKLIRVC